MRSRHRNPDAINDWRNTDSQQGSSAVNNANAVAITGVCFVGETAIAVAAYLDGATDCVLVTQSKRRSLRIP